MKRFIITGILTLCASLSFAQGPRDVVINEILVNNVNNYEDDYGHRVSWVELFNSGYSKVNLASCFLVIESEGETISYRIPKNDTRTIVDPQGYIVFFCEGTQSKGTFHTNFTLAMDKNVNQLNISNDIVDSTAIHTPKKDKIITLSLINANQKDTINKVTYNLAEQDVDTAMGRLKSEENDEFIFTKLNATTPYATNDTSDPVPNHEQFRQTDPIGYGMAITAMSVVLSALLVLYLIFRTVGKTMVHMANRKKGRAEAPANVKTKKSSDTAISGEEVAAIAIALKMFADDLHDQESTVLTINRVAKHYSPWSSKLYGMTQLPNRK